MMLSKFYPISSLLSPPPPFPRAQTLILLPPLPQVTVPGTQPRLAPRARKRSLAVVAVVAGLKLPTLLPRKKALRFICRDSGEGGGPDTQFQEKAKLLNEGNRDGDGSGSWNDWTSSILLLGLWSGLMYYVFQLAPNQTPYRDMYFLQKLCNLRGDDGFEMNPVLVAVWYIMGLWPLVYSMLLIPTGRSSRSKIPVWPFLVLSFFGGAYALIPYFVLWKPPPPPVEEDEITRWPLNILDSKITAGIILAAGLGLIIYAGLSSGEAWEEFYQYFRESKFIHATCIDFSLLSAFSAFWVYNDMTSRRWVTEGSWLLPVALVPFVGPSLYLLLRPSLSALLASSSSSSDESK